MTTSVTTSKPLWLAGGVYDADSGTDLRNSGVTAFMYDVGALTGSVIGVLGGVLGGLEMKVSAATGMQVSVGPGSFCVPNTTTPAVGGYVSTLASAQVFTVAVADPSNPRIDLVAANVVDNGDNTSFGQVQILTGVAAASPAAPSTPANGIALAQVLVPAGSTSTTSGNITDVRPFTVTKGGVLRAAKGTVAGFGGCLAWDSASDSFYENNLTPSTGRTQMRVLPFGPVSATMTTDWTFPSGSTASTILSVTVTVDGYTDLEITANWCGFYQATTVGSRQVQFTYTVDGTQIAEMDTQTASSDLTNIAQHGGSWTYRTHSGAGDTPGAGTHTIAWQGLSPSAGGFGDVPRIRAAATRNASLRVAAVTL